MSWGIPTREQGIVTVKEINQRNTIKDVFVPSGVPQPIIHPESGFKWEVLSMNFVNASSLAVLNIGNREGWQIFTSPTLTASGLIDLKGNHFLLRASDQITLIGVNDSCFLRVLESEDK